MTCTGLENLKINFRKKGPSLDMRKAAPTELRFSL
jgi:hypothetical protein